MPRQNNSSDLHRDIGQLLIIGFDGTEMSSRLADSADPRSTRRRHPVRAQHHWWRANLQPAERLSGLRIHTPVHRRGHGRRPGRSLPQHQRLKPFCRRRLRHRRPQALSQTRQSHRRYPAGHWDSTPTSRRWWTWPSKPSKTVMSSRAVSADPKQAVLYAREFLQGLRAARVIGSAKHFPGLGEANLDTHQELPSIT